MFEGFVHPLLAWGAALAAVPLIIHLLNRQRHKPMRWAAMRYMLAAYRRTRRRARLENLLLLLLRMAAVALLALALSRPFTGSDGPLASLTESRRDLVLVVDVSASTGYRESVQSVHEAIVERARAILEGMDAQRGDRVRFLAAAGRPRLLSARSPEDARSMLSTLGEPTDEPLDLALLLAELVNLAEEEAAGTDQSHLEVRLLTDLQRSSFVPRWDASALETTAPDDDAGASSGIAVALDRLAELGVRIGVENLGGAALTPPNLGIESVEPLHEVLGAGSATEVAVRVRNFGAGPVMGARVVLVVDGERYPSRRIDVEPRSSAQAVFRVPFPSAGAHTLVGELEGDRLAADDRRASVLDVPEPIRVLLVNGDPHPRIDRDEVGYLRAVLEPPVEDAAVGVAAGHSPFVVREEDALAFGTAEQDLAQHDVVVLANVNSISARVVTGLEEWVADGGVLFVTLGDRSADAGAIEALNARLWNAAGTGLLPAELFRAVEVPSRRDTYYRCSWFDASHPALAFFGDDAWRPFLTEVPIYAFVATEPPPKTTRVLARLDDEAKSPLLLERVYGRGRVVLWTTSIDRDWSRVADSPSTLIPLVHELLRAATAGDRPSRRAAVGSPMALELTSFPRAASVLQPDQSRRRLDAEPQEVGRNRWSLTVEELDRAGLWYLEHEEGRVPFAVELDPEEGDLARIEGAELARAHRVWYAVEPGEGEAEESGDASSRGELWRPLAWLALAALIAETLWSAWIGWERRRG